ncbi:rho guanine nucleotide exchange factor 2, partial [Nematolebias whitei]|uniref:rho guanine nucleotide exchange factor 2 n=1 Tax=Nematolebias whitei TaxID=451745 RepID=UPI00189AB767
MFKGGELLRRKLLHEGTLLWKVQGSRMKDVQVLLMSDILVFLQEKDQKFTFVSHDKSPVVSLNNLIVREVANQERGMYLISDSTPPEMYELFATSKEDRKTWMIRIQQTALSCPSRDKFPLIETEDKALVRRLRADIQQKDREVLELLQERVTLFSDLVQAAARGETEEERGVEVKTSTCRNLFRADTPHAPKAEPLLLAAMSEVDRLAVLLSQSSSLRSSMSNGNQEIRNGDSGSLNGSVKLNNSSSKDTNGNQLQEQSLNEEIHQRLVNVSTQLHALQRVCRGPLLRRHGVQECILLVTQRITKYPVLIQRILDNTKGCEDEILALKKALILLKELISSVDQEVLELDRTRRLQEIQARLDPRAQAEVQGGGMFKGGELLRRKLLHEGTLLWKVQGSRMKDVQVLLMSDILVFLQEKDQKFTFVSHDKSPVVSLNNLIVREVANQERGMYLISDSTPPEMYELFATSKEDR